MGSLQPCSGGPLGGAARAEWRGSVALPGAFETSARTMRLIAGRTALVTGATGGLGQAIARRLASEDVRLILTGRRQDVLDEVSNELGARPLVCDLAQREDV